jgi:hypothetical protein
MLPVGANYNAKIIARTKKGRQHRNAPPKPLVYLNTNICYLNKNWTPF